MTYENLIKLLKENAEEDFRSFQKRLIFTNAEILGVRTPILRKIAKSLQGETDVFSFPDEYYEVTFIKLAVATKLPFEQLLQRLDKLVLSIDNWATCDTFTPDCIKDHKDEFLPYIEKYFACGSEFSERFALIILLKFYVEEKYAPTIKGYLYRANTEKYYVRMAVAWLTAELLIKLYPVGEEILLSRKLDEKTHNKAIQKGIESFRLTKDQKAYLKTLKIK